MDIVIYVEFWSSYILVTGTDLLHPVKFTPLTHLPFHLRGGGPNPSSLKLGESGHTPARQVYNIS